MPVKKMSDYTTEQQVPVLEKQKNASRGGEQLVPTKEEQEMDESGDENADPQEGAEGLMMKDNLPLDFLKEIEESVDTAMEGSKLWATFMILYILVVMVTLIYSCLYFIFKKNEGGEEDTCPAETH